MQRKHVTIYDIAKRAGTSPSTVGAVMNGSWKARRISEARAEEIQRLARDMGYAINLQASALRKERSRIIGMILPMHDNRYFSSISQTFEREARARGLFPVISSTLRDPAIEVEAVKTLLSYRVERIVCTGATDPDSIAEICRARGVPTYNFDLPGSLAPSVISDNYQGARELTDRLIVEVRSRDGDPRRLLFVGGRPSDHNTMQRIKGFSDAIEAASGPVEPGNVLACGYAAAKAAAAIEGYLETHDMPPGIFVNSTIALEGVMNWFGRNGLERLQQLAFGCFDWDPFAALISPNITMVRQDVPTMIEALFEIIDKDEADPGILIKIPPVIVEND
ncbi:substrate-binding domain-containing protein [Rhodobium gokarnense]|uniref:LacI family fructose operon transcriptional repressor n=1 Tax=Rhodobium gokarnense TaxID=364296 RepID=A0ABT3HAE9_9HYPH|nr:substrate-binding domain-containing protein [Rhodobium gokarnense]MCW2307358.1 LacI family fructose operon transcriptional repressor [Rhodobium gokarnense]